MNNGDPREEIKALLRSGDLTAILVQATRLHGHYCPGLTFSVMAGWARLRRLGFNNTGMEELLAIVECNNCFVNGIQISEGELCHCCGRSTLRTNSIVPKTTYNMVS